MDKRTYESPMDWEYQNGAPMDPSSPFAQSTRQHQDKNPFGRGHSNFGTFNQNGFGRAPMTPSKPLPPTPMQQQPPQTPSIFGNPRTQRTTTSTTAPSFRNPAFTTPRKPFDMDEVSAAESSPAATDASDFPETPDHDQSVDLAHMTITPASMSKHRSLFAKKASGRGEIAKPVFASRDKIRKRKKYNANKDVSGYRLPYIQPGEGEGDSDYESDDSTFPRNKPQHHDHNRRSKDGWFGNFLATLQRHPYAPSILGYWLNFGFSLVCVTGTLWIGWAIIAGLREDFAAAKSAVRADILEEIRQCTINYRDNRCSPIEKRLPAISQLCEQWDACMNQDPDNLKRVQLGAKNIVEIINEIVDTMSYKTIALLILLLLVFLFSGRSLYKTANNYPDFTRHAPPAFQPHPSEHAVPQQVYWQAIHPQTPRRNLRHLPLNDETPETDVTPPPKMKALLPPTTPSARLSPTKVDRGRSPTKSRSRSPTKLY
ncbi:hypothetical protein GGR55DRAFT_689719 [Xylaria sp. FL0064]|nr:hypothetical protein GGR55DRAFT_689719 [Xylaria sp. FL0064]